MPRVPRFDLPQGMPGGVPITPLVRRAGRGLSSTQLRFGGTAFPVRPAVNDLFYRTDLGEWFFWNGTYWLSAAIRTQSFMQIPNSVDGMVTGITANAFFGVAPIRAPSRTWLERVEWAVQYSGGTINGSNYWRLDVATTATNTSRSTIFTGANNTADTPSEVAAHTEAIGGRVDVLNGGVGSAAQRYEISINKVGSPPVINIVATLIYRTAET